MLAARPAARLGCVISASHNPYRDNGIKFLGGDGRKLPDADEARIESLMDGALQPGGGVERFDDACERYVTWLAETFGEGVPSGTMLGVDCANGAHPRRPPRCSSGWGRACSGLAASRTAATSTPGLARRTSTPSPAWYERRTALGLAFDGDADRCLGVDAAGRPVNGDVILAVLAIDRGRRDLLPGRRVVVTSMTNLGFHRLMGEHDIAVEVTDVGDRYVLERMLERASRWAASSPATSVDLDHHTTGDGLATALLLLGALHRLGISMAEAHDLFQPFPQRLVGVSADRSLLPSATGSGRRLRR